TSLLSSLRVACRLILRVNICLHHTSCWTRMVWGGLPGTVPQFYPAQFLENDATPVRRRPDRPQSALAVSAILIAEYARLAHTVAAQPVRTKQTVALLINGANWLPIRNRRPDQSVHVFHCLDFRFDEAHLTFTIPLVRSIS